MYKLLFFAIAVFSMMTGYSQENSFTRQDSLRGSITKEREWWDLLYYHLNVKVNPLDSTISGSNLISYKVLAPSQRMQIDLQPPMEISVITQGEDTVFFIRDGNAFFLELPTQQKAGDINSVLIRFSGKPYVGSRPPWDGGFTWSRDNNGNPFIATSCQGEGASLWWPCKDHQYDEPDSVLISVTVPEPLTNVSNGRLRGITNNDDSTNTSHWFVSNPINNYSVSVNIGDYVHFGETYEGLNGKLDCDYYVLSYNLEKAKKQFKQVPMMLEAFEHWFGPYPFYEDSYKLVEAPYLGMEHQSAVTYGNLYTNGYWGTDLSGTGWGLKFDFIIIHESGHEWFGNNITTKDIADMWVHEGFTNYSESLYLDYHFGTEAANEYIIGERRNIQNQVPLIGPYDVNHMSSGDIYAKGANLLHTLRQLIEDDEEWRRILVKMNKEFYHQTVTSKQVEDFLSRESNKDLSAFFNQYLRDTRIPKLEYRLGKREIEFRYVEIVEDFDMPIRVFINGDEEWIFPTSEWKTFISKKKIKAFEVDENFYVLVGVLE